MRTVYIDESTKGIRLGYRMENAYDQIVYTAPEDWTGSITCFLLKPGDTRAVPILSAQEGRTITSTLTEANLAEAGRGAVEYLMSDGTVIAKPDYTVDGYGWNDGPDISMMSLPSSPSKNYIACTPLIVNGKKVLF